MSPKTEPIDPVVAVRDTQSGAEATVKALAKAGFDMTKVSVIGKSHKEEHAHGFYALGDRARTWGATGGFWGVVWGMLLGSAIFVLPPVGVVAAAGPITVALVAALESAMVVGGVSALCMALASGGMSREQAMKYQEEIDANRFLVLVHGTPEDVLRARDVLAAAQASHELPFHQAA